MRFFTLLNSLQPGQCFQAPYCDVVEAAWTEQDSALFGRVGDVEVREFLHKIERIHDLAISHDPIINVFTFCKRNQQ